MPGGGRRIDRLTRFAIGAASIWIIAVCPRTTAADQMASERPPVADRDVEVLHFETMIYPLYARVRSIEGAVVLRAAIDASGRVSEVTALSGPKALLDESRENLKRWRFASPKRGTAVVVYWFRIRGVCEPPCMSGFEFYPPNIVVVTSGRMIATP